MYEKLSNGTLGYAFKRAKCIKFFTDESENLLSQALEKRNYVVHNLFKEDLKNNHLETDPTFFYEELEETIDLLHSINESLIDIFEKQKGEYKLIW